MQDLSRVDVGSIMCSWMRRENKNAVVMVVVGKQKKCGEDNNC